MSKRSRRSMQSTNLSNRSLANFAKRNSFFTAVITAAVFGTAALLAPLTAAAQSSTSTGGSSGSTAASSSASTSGSTSGSSKVQRPVNDKQKNTGVQQTESGVPADTLEDSSKAGSAKRAANSASSQNAISALTMPMSADKKWNVYLGVDYTQDTFNYTDRFQEFGLSYYYQLDKSLLFASTSYVAPTTYVATTSERLQLQDSSVGWMHPNFTTIQKAKLDIITAVTIPTNEFSRIRGQTVQAFGALDTKFSFLHSGLFIIRVGAQGTGYQYRTADRQGRTPNTPFTGIARALVRYTFFQRLLLAGALQYAPSWDFNSNQYDNQSASVTATFFLNSQISLSGGWAWSDQVKTNYSIFDPSRSQWNLGLSVGI